MTFAIAKSYETEKKYHKSLDHIHFLQDEGARQPKLTIRMARQSLTREKEYRIYHA